MNGIEMLIKNVLGIDPEQMRSYMDETVKTALTGIKNIDERLTRIEANQRAIMRELHIHPCEDDTPNAAAELPRLTNGSH